VNRDGTLFNMAYGNPCSVSVDPIEKKPLFHFFPGSEIYSVATAGCNFRCLNCQNWEISQASPMDLRQYEMKPEKLVQKALLNHTDSIAFTYTEPTVFYEFMLATVKPAQEKGLKNVMISNGYINEKPLLELCQYLDAANIDLKCFDDVIYHRLTGGHLQPVLDSLKVLKKQGVWLEITNLLIPDISDGTAMIETMCGWLVDNGFSETPLHFSRFFPTYKLQQTLPTSGQSLLKAKEIAEKSGMQYVYIGNLPGLHGENTFCPNCKNILVERNGYVVSKNSIENCLCSFCGEHIAGVWQ
jgi:pyruvate formate lyase activating enzyme